MKKMSGNLSAELRRIWAQCVYHREPRMNKKNIEHEKRNFSHRYQQWICYFTMLLPCISFISCYEQYIIKKELRVARPIPSWMWNICIMLNLLLNVAFELNVSIDASEFDLNRTFRFITFSEQDK